MNNEAEQAIVVIGASAGGMTPLLNLIADIPEDCTASVFVVQHIPAHAENNLGRILSHKSKLPVLNAEDGMSIAAGTVYTAAPDHHLLLEEGKLVVAKGPRENHWRPSVDALFRSAAYSHRRRVIGIVLSGALNDGTSGLWNIKQFGGTSIIQSRSEAVFDGMPSSAAIYTEIDYELPSDEIGQLVGKLSKEMINDKSPASSDGNEKQEEFTKFEIGAAKGENALAGGVLSYGKFTPLTCPECHGALTEYSEGKLRRYRCHTGHAHTAESLLVGIDNNIETSMWEVMRGMEEGQLLLGHMADVLEQGGHLQVAQRYRNNAVSLSRRSKIVKSALLDKEPLDVSNS